MLSLILAMSLGQSLPAYCKDAKNPQTCYYGVRATRDPRKMRGFGRNNNGGRELAFFEFAPPEGTGMGAACACSAITGAKGEVVTWTRAGSAYCTKEGAALTGLTNSSMVLCSSNLPRVEADGSGVLGVRVEAARTNTALRSEEIAVTAPWALDNAGGRSVNPTVNAGVTPWGATTATQLEYTDVGNTNESATTFQTLSVTSGTAYTFSVYLKGVSGGTGVYIYIFDTTLPVSGKTLCTYNTSTWTRCSVTYTAAATSAAGAIGIGGNTFNSNAMPISATTVLAAGAQLEVGSHVTSYIATAGSSVARAVDSPTIALPVAVSTAAASHAVSFTPLWSSASPGALGYLLTYGGNASPVYFATSDARSFDSTTQVILSTTYTARAATRIWSSYTGVLQTINNGSTSTTGAFDGAMPVTTTLNIGHQGGINQIQGIMSRVCADSDTTRCR